MLFQIDKGSLAFGTTEVFNSLQLLIKENEKIAIVGANGAGKTTLLKILSNQLTLDQGSFHQKRNINIGLLSQMAFEDESLSVKDAFQSSFSLVIQLEKKLQQITQYLQNDPSNSKYLIEYERVFNEFEQHGGYQVGAQMETVITKMGFNKEDQKRTIDSFSGGQKTRLALAKLLLSYPDVLLLDEPTNHLDLAMIEWLENFLAVYPKAVIVVSHDRMFINKLAKSILAIENKQVVRYMGNYDDYIRLRALNIEKQESAFNRQQQEIQRLEAQIEKFRYKKNKAAFAQSKIKYLDRLEKVEKPHDHQKKFQATFTPRLKGAKEVLVLDHLEIGYDKPLATISLTITKNQKIAVVGENGVGKSTLLKTIVNQLPPLSGEMLLGHQIEIGYFDQQMAQLNSTKSVIEELWEANWELDKTEIRSILGRFLFSNDDVFKLVSQLSGGEKVRLTLAKLMCKQANFLVLDEPTNHLDILAKEALEASLKEYSGTILFVSHDRYFIDQIATDTLLFNQQSVSLLSRQPIQQVEEKVEKTQKQIEREIQIQQRADKAKLKRQLERLESQITEAELNLNTLRAYRDDPEYYHDYMRMNQLNDQIDEAVNIIAHYMHDWEQLHQQLEEKNESI